MRRKNKTMKRKNKITKAKKGGGLFNCFGGMCSRRQPRHEPEEPNTPVANAGPGNAAVANARPSNAAVANAGPGNAPVANAGPGNAAVANAGPDEAPPDQAMMAGEIPRNARPTYDWREWERYMLDYDDMPDEKRAVTRAAASAAAVFLDQPFNPKMGTYFIGRLILNAKAKALEMEVTKRRRIARKTVPNMEPNRLAVIKNTQHVKIRQGNAFLDARTLYPALGAELENLSELAKYSVTASSEVEGRKIFDAATRSSNEERDRIRPAVFTLASLFAGAIARAWIRAGTIDDYNGPHKSAFLVSARIDVHVIRSTEDYNDEELSVLNSKIYEQAALELVSETERKRLLLANPIPNATYNPVNMIHQSALMASKGVFLSEEAARSVAANAALSAWRNSGGGLKDLLVGGGDLIQIPRPLLLTIITASITAGVKVNDVFALMLFAAAFEATVISNLEAAKFNVGNTEDSKPFLRR